MFSCYMWKGQYPCVGFLKGVVAEFYNQETSVKFLCE